MRLRLSLDLPDKESKHRFIRYRFRFVKYDYSQ